VYSVDNNPESQTLKGHKSSVHDEGEQTMEKVNIAQKLSLVHEYWSPRIAGELNDTYVKLAKLKGEYAWHQHEAEDQLFLVVRGNLVIKLRDRDILLEEGEFMIIPKGVEHLPVAKEEVQLLLLDPKSLVNTGNVRNERTVEDQWI